ncbi:MAG: glycerate kinase [Chloroflexi bacterium]|nr:glycerate kinase [Chloroflexota bacterium]|tara:strand:+ start:16116 stop:17264 length:1149 start_codon:yes stop_codon:yes gene_type:complete
MKIVIAPDSYKGSISALNVARSIESGIKKVLPNAECIIVPAADGGDGTLETLVEGSNGEIRSSEVTGPLGEKRNANWGALGDGNTAVIEMALTSGLALVPEKQLDPLNATTFGLGEIISDALENNFRKFIIGIGGSATNDGGAGMIQALGGKLLDSNGQEITPGGASLIHLDQIDISTLDSRAKDSDFLIACDVNNPLCGPEGASAIYGPQKGSTPEMVKQLDKALFHYAKIIRRDLGIDISTIPGSGAAGGLGGGFVGFLNGKLLPGVDIVLDFINLDDRLKDADLVITGEGATDQSTIYNKAPIGIANRAKKFNIPVISISGSLNKGFKEVHNHGINASFSIINAPMDLSEATENASDLIASISEEIIRTLKLGKQIFAK